MGPSKIMTSRGCLQLIYKLSLVVFVEIDHSDFSLPYLTFKLTGISC